MIIDVILNGLSGMDGFYRVPSANEWPGQAKWQQNTLHFREETSVQEIKVALPNLLDRIKIKLGSAFGLWLGRQ
jgi:hypothetical protein